MFKIGHGYDSHCFTEGNFITLGGVIIPHDKSFKAHSDGDVVIHALCDALLGALALGDIGQHFPDTDPTYRNIDSRILLKKVNELIHTKSFFILNLDVTILAERPKLLPYISKMRENLAQDLVLEIEQVSIKAKTNESMGFIGRQEGMAAQAVVLLSG